MALAAAEVETTTKPKNWIAYIQKDLPQHLDWWPYTLGAIPLTLFGILVATGLMLTFTMCLRRRKPTRVSTRSPMGSTWGGLSGASTSSPSIS